MKAPDSTWTSIPARLICACFSGESCWFTKTAASFNGPIATTGTPSAAKAYCEQPMTSATVGRQDKIFFMWQVPFLSRNYGTSVNMEQHLVGIVRLQQHAATGEKPALDVEYS